MTAPRSAASTMPARCAAGLAAALKAAGGPTKLAVALSAIGAPITKQAVRQWGIIPVARVLDVERVTGLHRSTLRPDLYPDEATRQRA